LVLIKKLLDAGCKVKGFDPVAMTESKRILGDKITFANDIYDAVNDADALLLVTEWKEFRMPTWAIVHKVMKKQVIFDGRNIYDPADIKKNNFEYFGIGL
jgi:UDPglucose 6-dehydrogenase